MSPSQSVLGTHAGSLEDCWRTAFYISSTAGGDPGQPGLFGQPTIESARKPQRVMRLETRGWDDTTEETKAVFEQCLSDMAGAGVTVISRRDDARVEELEQALYKISDFIFDVLAYEARWPIADYNERFPGKLSDAIIERHERSIHITPESYRELLAQRDQLRTVYASCKDMADACVLLCSTGPATPYPDIGDPIYGDVSSTLASPAFALPMLAVEGLPVGLQYMGWPHDDYDLARQSRWLIETLK